MTVAELVDQSTFPARTWQEVEKLIGENVRFKAHSGSIYWGNSTFCAMLDDDERNAVVRIEYSGPANQALAANELWEYCRDRKIRFDEDIRGPRTVLKDLRRYGVNLIGIADRLNGNGSVE